MFANGHPQVSGSDRLATQRAPSVLNGSRATNEQLGITGMRQLNAGFKRYSGGWAWIKKGSRQAFFAPGSGRSAADISPTVVLKFSPKENSSCQIDFYLVAPNRLHYLWYPMKFINLWKVVLGAMVAVVISASPSRAQNIFVDLELSLLIDVSGSVDSFEYALQRGGYALAFRNPEVHAAIVSGPLGTIAVNAIQFDGFSYPAIPWTQLSSAADALVFADLLESMARRGFGSTGIGQGIQASTASILTNEFTGTRKVIDVSGDGTNNSGVVPGIARDEALAAGITTINGITIDDPNGTIRDHFESEVIGGQDAFARTAVTFEDFEIEILAKLVAEITGGAVISNDALPISSALRISSIALGRTMSRDVGNRLFRMRSGVRPEATTVTLPGTPSIGAKGGMAKGIIEPITTTYYPQWEVWGQIFYSDITQDARYQTIQAGTARRLVQAKTDTEIFGGTVGAEYRFGGAFTAGLAFSAANADITLRGVGSADVDSVALMPYVSYYRPAAFAGADFYADALYAYSWNDYDSRRTAGFGGSTDGNSHQIELNTGLNFRGGPVVHGPYAQFRWLDGDIDGFTDSGGLVFADSDYKSKTTQLGYQVSHPIAMQAGMVVPQARVAWEHEFEADQGTIGAVPLGNIDKDLMVLGAGVGVFFRNGWNGILDYEARLGSKQESHYVGLKLGKEF